MPQNEQVIAAVVIILGPLVMSFLGIILATDYRGWRDAAAKAHGGVWNAGYSRAYTTFRYVGLMAAWMGAVFAAAATVLVIFIYAR
ncbi:hypothetical protein [Streptomyces sp. TRM68367]|uniref:hypothetical protein n=1 Tax=Streptomyces sp. TRM68367 TaxID=2758415 RepID=UPI00165AC0FE|nr:hypothetical protein [Streptomyces sp. TRM68367]MBC9729812.1 hypothetical protein [Streptomyces sp. TRM68367]